MLKTQTLDYLDALIEYQKSCELGEPLTQQQIKKNVALEKYASLEEAVLVESFELAGIKSKT